MWRTMKIHCQSTMLRTDCHENQALTTPYTNNLILLLFPGKWVFDKWTSTYTFLFFRSIYTAYINRSPEYKCFYCKWCSPECVCVCVYIYTYTHIYICIGDPPLASLKSIMDYFKRNHLTQVEIKNLLWDYCF